MATKTPMQLSVSTKAQNAGATVPPAPELGLTPPVTPTVEDDSPAETGATLPRVVGDAHNRDQTPAVSGSLQFSDQLEYQLDQEGHRIEFGRGAWSVVHKAFSSPRVDSGSPPFTPPSSPTPSSRLVAVKSPARRDACAVLQAEALTLSRARSVTGSENHVVRFHGYIADSNSLVLSAVPLSLSTYIEDKARLAEKNITTRNMREPVQGMRQWHDLAKKLITGLLWLHSDAQIVHGDIKPHNVLLKPRMSIDQEANSTTDFPYDPLFADFSSSHPITTSEKSLGAASTALTPPFTAPELLSSLLSSPGTPPTPASDVFSLAVTLLSAATGDLLLYPSQRCLLMSRDGHQVINFVQLGQNGTRVPKNGTVEKILKPAVAKNAVERIKPSDWLRLAQTVA
ncbi:protein kinase domain-containing protein [Aspergillus lucknowensis]|uniref:Kinase-like domain-containing protein n=1 Tax=Aspergillus lucknowensis TaxID=176173 RepID=A0ABR4LMR8_9EURO